MIARGKKAGVVSLGCDKNRVDTERMLGILADAGMVLTGDPAEAEIIVVNTCAFLESARAEAIEEILSLAEYRTRGALEKLVVTGCLPQKFIGELFDELTEADVFLGFRDYDLLPAALERAYAGERVNLVGAAERVSEGRRIVTTPLHYAYLKIADGCDNRCTYCLIPAIRGKYRSEPLEKLVREAEGLGELSELILVAQDVTRYGEDLYGENRLIDLIRALSALPNIGAIRLLYCYPDKIGDALIAEIRDNPKLVKYLDIPLQHADGAVLKRMNRKGTGEEYLRLIARLRREIPDIALRSTFIAGFPGESDAAFENLKSFLRRTRLEYAGFFAYSAEEGTPAARLKDQIAEEEKQSRVAELYRLQEEIGGEILRSRTGSVISVTFDGIDYEKGAFYGHAPFQCPEIDGRVYFTASDAVQGKTYRVRVERAENFELFGGVE